MTSRFLALSLGVFLCVACGPKQSAPARAPAGHVLEQTAEQTAELEPEPGAASSPEVSPERPAAAADEMADEATCIERSWQVVSRELEETLREFEELERHETLSLQTDDEREGHCARSVSIPDLDGDGREEMDLSAGCRWNTTWPHVLFLSRGCRFAGVIWSADVFRYLPRAGAEPSDIVTHSSNGCAGQQFTEERHRWNGTHYESIARVDCDLCEEWGTRGPQPAACNQEDGSVSW